MASRNAALQCLERTPEADALLKQWALLSESSLAASRFLRSGTRRDSSKVAFHVTSWEEFVQTVSALAEGQYVTIAVNHRSMGGPSTHSTGWFRLHGQIVCVDINKWPSTIVGASDVYSNIFMYLQPLGIRPIKIPMWLHKAICTISGNLTDDPQGGCSQYDFVMYRYFQWLGVVR